MKFFRNIPVAVSLTVLVVALCCFWGYERANLPVQTMEDVSGDRAAGQSDLNYHLNWLDDAASLFTLDTIDAIARRNLVLDSTYHSFLAIQTVSYLNGADIETYAEETAQRVHLTSQGLLLVLDKDSQTWYVACGEGMLPYSQEDKGLPQIFKTYLDEVFWEEGAGDRVILALMDDLEGWYEDTLPSAQNDSSSPFFQTGGATSPAGVTLRSIFNGILLTVLANLWWIVLALVVLNIADRVLLFRYLNRLDTQLGLDIAPFHPLLFWHGPNSRWYQRMLELDEEEEEEEPGTALQNQ